MHLIVDIDGTLFDNTQRLHLVPKDPSHTENWTPFNKACEDDAPIPHIINQVCKLFEMDQLSQPRLDFLTSRGADALPETHRQLSKYFDMHRGNINLYMRAMDCYLPPADYKYGMLRLMFKQGISQIKPVILFDDHPAVIDMVQKHFPFITTVQVPSQCITVTNDLDQHSKT